MKNVNKNKPALLFAAGFLFVATLQAGSLLHHRSELAQVNTELERRALRTDLKIGVEYYFKTQPLSNISLPTEEKVRILCIRQGGAGLLDDFDLACHIRMG
jgi:hypothetical protein